jgi:hypothetical protein
MTRALEDFCGAIRGKFKGDLIRQANPEFRGKKSERRLRARPGRLRLPTRPMFS